MAKTLREIPEILILDKGHSHRSTKSRLRKYLMKLPTELRILLSGRPKYVDEVLQELDSKYIRKGYIENKSQHFLKAPARKFFLDNIAKKINANIMREKLLINVSDEQHKIFRNCRRKWGRGIGFQVQN
ncbi:chromatin remodeling protein, putative [Medicago truncatula]|uniref:Chromatin remodeling protein, putative n=1 Tax=Medicago truncatula TaxID=3880 RepID=G7J2C6_MEDTR|nr:chromatin remodeling protein, putative [Medicago truncatula]